MAYVKRAYMLDGWLKLCSVLTIILYRQLPLSARMWLLCIA